MKGSVSSFFEGTEKKVELVVDPALKSLRRLGDDFWAGIVHSAGAGVISKIANRRAEAFLLSESSLFVFDHKVLMLTCGQTTLHEAVLALLDVVPPERVRSLIYERKNEVRPRDQPTTFLEDVRVLNERLPGRAYRFGDRDEHHLYLFHVDRRVPGDARNTTIEVLMRGLDEKVRNVFSRTMHPTTRGVRETTGVDRILPGFQVNDHLFHPAGYSLNAIRDDAYYAVHVTPELASSYASFETNQPLGAQLDRVIRRLLDTFRPRTFDLVLFDRAAAPTGPDGFVLRSGVEQGPGHGSDVRFLSFYRPQRELQRAIELPLGAPLPKAVQA